MWQMRVVVIPLIVGAPGVIKEGISKQLGEIPGNSNLWEIRKTALPRTAHIIRRVVFIK